MNSTFTFSQMWVVYRYLSVEFNRVADQATGEGLSPMESEYLSILSMLLAETTRAMTRAATTITDQLKLHHEPAPFSSSDAYRFTQAGDLVRPHELESAESSETTPKL